MNVSGYNIDPNANLQRADLRGTDLQRADLRGANLQRTDLRGANLQYANLCDANLQYADLQRANLRDANLYDANLQYANLQYANLYDANLQYADLRGADLHGTDLQYADLRGAHVADTCLDPDNKPNANVTGFRHRKDTRYVIGYRTRKAGHIDMYRNGRTYNADWFSTAGTTCHPGLYIWPTRGDAVNWSGYSAELIRVSVRVKDIHRAGNKWRCREFMVLGKA